MPRAKLHGFYGGMAFKFCRWQNSTLFLWGNGLYVLPLAKLHAFFKRTLEFLPRVKTPRFFMGNGLYVLSSLEYGTPRVAGAPTFLFKVSVEVKKRTTIVSR